MRVGRGRFLDGVRHALRKDPEVDGWLEEASVAAELGRFSDALALMSKVLERRPDDADCLADAAFFTEAVGQHEEAVELYLRAAAARGADGEPLFMAVLILAETGAPPERAEVLLVEALARSPELVHEVLAEDALLSLLERPGVDAAVNRALEHG